MRLIFLLAVAAVNGIGSAISQPVTILCPETAAPSPADRARIRAREAVTRAASTEIVVHPDPGFEAADIVWRGDLNGDGVPDVVLRFPEACGNWGECPYAVYVGCGESRFVSVWGPDYAVDIEVRNAPLASRDWRELIKLERNEQAEAKVSTRRLRFDSDSYKAVGTTP